MPLYNPPTGGGITNTAPANTVPVSDGTNLVSADGLNSTLPVGDSSFAVTHAETAPAAPDGTSLNGTGAGNVTNGIHRVKVTFITAEGETEAGTQSDAVNVTDNTTDGKVYSGTLPVGSALVTARKVYMSTAGTSNYFLVTGGTVANNDGSQFLEINDSDATLLASTPAPSANTTADPLIKVSATESYLKSLGTLGVISSGSLAVNATKGNLTVTAQSDVNDSGGLMTLTTNSVLQPSQTYALIMNPIAQTINLGIGGQAKLHFNDNGNTGVIYDTSFGAYSDSTSHYVGVNNAGVAVVNAPGDLCYIGDALSGGNGIVVDDGAIEERIILRSPAVVSSAPPATTAAKLANGQISFYLDEVGNLLKVAVKYSDGTTKTGSVALV
jgi:hypothetical protein